MSPEADEFGLDEWLGTEEVAEPDPEVGVIRRVRKRPPFAAIDARVVNDGRVSFRALGVLVWILDKRPGWSCSARRLSTSGEGREGRDALLSALRELGASGYIERVKRQTPTGRWVTDTVVHDLPNQPSPENPDPVQPDPVDQDVRPQNPVTTKGQQSQSDQNGQPTRTHPSGPVRTAEQLAELDGRSQPRVPLEKITALKEQLRPPREESS